ncbi:protein LYK2-like [Rutidosis leptorrhynchoides]|uniref:protein LYK2-like n=1 Tax=Rutidosis leptorrhynchoides TaxID=125765 RepID=UPI003A99C5FA
MWEPQVYISVSIVAFIICIAIVASTLYIILWKNKNKTINLHHGSLSNKNVDLELQQLSLSVRSLSENKISFESSTHKPIVVETFTIEELNTATANFCSSNLINGRVYHGRHKGKELAIKCTNQHLVSKIKFELFQDSTYFHPNIVKLLGTCTTGESDDAYLVFEYAKNGSLKDWIHGGLAIKSQFIASCNCHLTWNQRLRICLDVATGLQFMHQIMSPSYVHRNIKSRNIFLDEEFNAKIGNFGMDECGKSKSISQKGSTGVEPFSCDTGYIAPELLGKSSDAMTKSIDIYAFGVVLLEIISGKSPLSKMENEEKNVLLHEKINLIMQSSDAGEKLREWVDDGLKENYSFDAAVALANLAKACVDEDPLLRPNASEVVQKLSKLVSELHEGEEERFNVGESSSKPLVVKV